MNREKKEINPIDSTFGTESHSSGRLHALRTTLMAGVTVIAPLWITGAVLLWLFNAADRFSRPLIRPVAAMFGDADWYYRGVGFVLTFTIVWVVGLITRNVLGRRLVQDAREALERLPVVRTIYSPVRKLMETMTSPDRGGFKQVILFEYPRRGLWTLGFVAGDVPGEGGLQAAHSVFIPTAPNPTTGFMLIIPLRELRLTNLTIEEAFQMIVSAGAAVPLKLSLPADIVSPGAPAVEADVVRDAAAAELKPDPSP